MKNTDHAFPCATGSDGGVYQRGMTLRDYFAAKAMPLLMKLGFRGRDLAESAYAQADAMLIERTR